MARGIIYVMSTAVPGLVKIGKTGTENFEDRMYNLERNGYLNVTALMREFAIEVEDYDAKEKLLHEIFEKSRLTGSELFALDLELVIQLLSSFEGTQIYPTEETKEEVFDKSTIELQEKTDSGILPNGRYYLERTVRGFGKVNGRAIIENGVFTVLKGSICAPSQEDRATKARRSAKIKNNVLVEDVICDTPSSAGWIVIGNHNNGWQEWRDELGNPIDVYRM